MTDLSVILSAAPHDGGDFYQTPRPRVAPPRHAAVSLPARSAEGVHTLAMHRHQHHQYYHHRRSVEEQEQVQKQKQAQAQAGDGKKKARGRPRVEPRDGTAADRRRTQIRLAQRAYRNRKETAIQTLEERLHALQDSNEEMSRTLAALYDAAVSQGLLDSAPDFGRQLRDAAEKFADLARRSEEGEGGACGGGGVGSDGAQTSPTPSNSPESIKLAARELRAPQHGLEESHRCDCRGASTD